MGKIESEQGDKDARTPPINEISKKISTETTNKLLAVFLVVVIIMCVYNAYRFGGEVICRR